MTGADLETLGRLRRDRHEAVLRGLVDDAADILHGDYGDPAADVLRGVIDSICDRWEDEHDDDGLPLGPVIVWPQ